MGNICGVVNPADLTEVYLFNELTPSRYAYTGFVCDRHNPGYDNGVHGHKGKQLPGNYNIFYFVAADTQISTPQHTYLARATYDQATNLISVVYKELPQTSTQQIPLPNQLDVMADGTVLLPVGGTTQTAGDFNIIKVTNTLALDPASWTATTYTFNDGGQATSGSFCIAIAGNYGYTVIRTLVNGTYKHYVAGFHIDLMMYTDKVQIWSGEDPAQMPVNMEYVTVANQLVLIDQSGDANCPALISITPSTYAIRYNALQSTGGLTGELAVATDATDCRTIERYNRTPLGNPLRRYTHGLPTGTWAYQSVITMAQPQSQPQHFDYESMVSFGWFTAYGTIAADGKVRSNGADTDITFPAQHYALCTGGPR